MHIHVKCMSLLLLTCALAFTACDSEENVTILPIGGGNSPLSAGKITTYKVDGVSFNMSNVPAVMFFPTGKNDDGFESITDSYLMAETEVTYKLWYKVRTWAEAPSIDHDGNGMPGDDVYSFANNGCEGNDGGFGAEPTAARYEPVTHINWRDAIVWCNALTEYYNVTNGTGDDLDCVYYTDAGYDTLLRASTNAAVPGTLVSGLQDQPYIMASADGNTDMEDCVAKGFRLPTSNEWECAARYINSALWTPGNYASGATADALDSAATTPVAWYLANSNDTTHKVRGRRPNALGLYDMSGNAYEWCFDWHPLYPSSQRVRRGGSWRNSVNSYMYIGWAFESDPFDVDDHIGFRFAKTR